MVGGVLNCRRRNQPHGLGLGVIGIEFLQLVLLWLGIGFVGVLASFEGLQYADGVPLGELDFLFYLGAERAPDAEKIEEGGSCLEGEGRLPVGVVRANQVLRRGGRPYCVTLLAFSGRIARSMVSSANCST